MKCPKCKHDWRASKSELASELGKKSLGKKKKYSDEEIKARTERLKVARKKYLKDTKFNTERL